MATTGETGGEGSAVPSSLLGCLMPAMRASTWELGEEEGRTRRSLDKRERREFEDAELRVLPKYVRGRVHTLGSFECFAVGFPTA